MGGRGGGGGGGGGELVCNSSGTGLVKDSYLTVTSALFWKLLALLPCANFKFNDVFSKKVRFIVVVTANRPEKRYQQSSA